MRSFNLRGAVAALALTVLAYASPAGAQMMLTGAGGYASAGAGGCISGPTLCATYQGHFEDVTDRSTSYVKTAGALGTATSDRIIVLGLTAGSASAATIGTPTCAAVSLTKAVSSPNTSTQIEIWYGAVPSGTTCDITVPVGSGTLSRMAFDWWTVTGTTHTTPSAIADATAASVSGTSKSSTGMTVASGGVAFAMARTGAVATAFTCNSGSCNTRRGNQVGVESQWDYAGDSGVSGGAQTWTASLASTGNIAVAAIAWAP
jgi:hypothetical protein